MIEHNGHVHNRAHLKFSALTLAIGLVFGASHANAQSEQFDLGAPPGDDFLLDSLPRQDIGIDYKFVSGYAIAQGDMVLGTVTVINQTLTVDKYKRGRITTVKGTAANKTFDRWNDGIVPYQFNTGITEVQRTNALQAIKSWNDQSTILLVERTDANKDQYKDFIGFESSPGCASYVGKLGDEQTVWISDACSVGSIIHEIGHALGLYHEHTRDDRDNYVTVNMENIKAGKESNFSVVRSGAATYGDHDYGSIMHYGAFFFSKNGKATISAPDGQEIGQRKALSANDIKTINDMYQTDLSLVTKAFGSGAQTEIDITVANEGPLGANSIELTLNMGSQAEWLSFSKDSGWTCKTFDTELRCTRPTLAQNKDTQFTVLVDPKNATAANLKANVISRTQDTDTTNNVVNDTLSEVRSDNNAGDTLAENAALSTGSTGVKAPPVGAASGGGGGGSTGYAFVVMSLLGWALRRKQRLG